MLVSSSIREIEKIICKDLGRGIQSAAGHLTAGSLEAAVRSIAEHEAPSIAIITGFFIASGDPPAAETDGPPGAAHMAAAFVAAGIPCRIVTDTPCEGALRASMSAIGIEATVPLDVVALKEAQNNLTIGQTEALWYEQKISHVISIERCGPSKSGKPKSARGINLSDWTAPLEKLFTAGDWKQIAIGDGGNEIGMGALPADLIAESVVKGEEISCAISCDHLILAGVSNWGGWAMVSALALVLPNKSAALLSKLNVETDNQVLKELVDNGPSIDGIKGVQAYSVDNFDQSVTINY